MAAGFLRDNKAMQTIRARVAFHSRQHGFDKCMQQIREGAHKPLSPSVIANLYAYWGDPLRPSDESYIRSCLAEVHRTEGQILQCGGSLMTMLLGAVCDSGEESQRQIWCLEHDRHWANVVRSWLTEYQVGRSHVIHSRARMFDGYAWYSVDGARLAKSYSLVLCEGARATPRGAIGVLTRIKNRLADDFVLLARDISQAEDLKTLAAWAKRHDAKCVLVDRQEGFVKIIRQTTTVEESPPSQPPLNSGRQAAG